MKRLMSSVFLGLILAGAGLMLGGCEELSPENWEFQNHSSWRVYVAPNGQHWSAFMISPGGRIETDYDGDNIQYIYMPSNKVRVENGKNRTIHFYNR